ncbi:uncharacterized protein LOC131211627 [Anopheles bellator]|uniref:uncharacterized protein LOC131211627 n=1 Tax=Anopheles bellator TaxID=139047 RepID=UPI002647FCCB|nr:uncharacterized protein LOC131211627 [Anopheles bellator]
MPSVEPVDEAKTEAESGPVENGAPNGDQDTPDQDRHLVPADRIEHNDASTIDLPTVREFTQNDTINKFLLNSFLQRMNDTIGEDQQRAANGEGSEEQEQDFDS